MENFKKEPMEELEDILHSHISGRKAYAAEVILAVCRELSKRESPAADAAEIYRRYLCKFLPDDIKKDL